MQLTSIQLDDFRNFTSVTVPLNRRLNIFLGENGQGKTNFLESVYMLTNGRSFRPGDSTKFLRMEGTNRTQCAKVRGFLEDRQLRYTIDLAIDDHRKNLLLNGKRTNSAQVLKRFPSVLFSPESLAVIKEGPEHRRALLDEVVITHNPQQVHLLREFTKCLRTRNVLLKDLLTGEFDRQHLLTTLEALNKIYLLLATHLSFARVQALRALEPHLAEAMNYISEGNLGDISVDYLVSEQSARDYSESQLYNAMHHRLQELSRAELSSGTTLVGPQKHDVKFLVDGNDSRFYCSQGQQRALILSLKIAQIVYHYKVHQTYPILLLDDVLSELDTRKRINLLKFLEGISAQILMTSTDLSWSEQLVAEENAIFKVADGRIERAKIPEV